MSLAATGTAASAVLAAVHTSAAQAALTLSSGEQSADESSFATVEEKPQHDILPIGGGLWRKIDSDESETAAVLGYENTDPMLDSAVVYLTGSISAVLSLLLLGFTLLSVFSKTKDFFGNVFSPAKKETKPFFPFVRRGDEVSPFNPVRIYGEELPGKPADTSASSRIFGRRGIQ